MIAEVIAGYYDHEGRRVSAPSRKRYPRFAPNAPMGRHVTQPLTVVCNDLDDLREFLQTCRYLSDKEQFGRDDYWAPPERFERSRKGDCDDFALWTWRQLMRLGYAARFVVGRAGGYGAGHAWVTFERDGRIHVLESLRAASGSTFPRLTTVRYEPRISVAWDGQRLTYFEHDPPPQLTLRQVLPLLPEWTAYWIRTRPHIAARSVASRVSRLKRRLFSEGYANGSV